MTWERAWSSTAKTTDPISHSASVQLIRCYLIYRGLARQIEGDMGLKGIQANTVHLILIYPGWFSAYHWGAMAVDPAACLIFVASFFLTNRVCKLSISPSLLLSKPSSIPSQYMVPLRCLPYRRWGFNSCTESPGVCPGVNKPLLSCGQEVWDVVFKMLLVMVGLQ